MSAYQEVTTLITDGSHLLTALKEMGFDPKAYETPMPLMGYEGAERPERAHIVIPRNQVGGASNDIGFVKEVDGKYRAIISEFDKRRYNQTWLGKLTASYAEIRAMSIAKSKGYTFLGKQVVDGRVKLQFQVRS